MSVLSSTDVNKMLGKTTANTTKNVSTKATTDRGTTIVTSNETFDKNSFLKLLSAQLANLDPTQSQDSTAYVTQMAQFSAMEQMYNLNSTMSNYAYQNLIGKGVTVNVADKDGNAYTGIVRGVSSDATGTYLSVEVNENGKNIYKVFDVKKVVSVLGTPDYTNSNMLVNSDFIAASNLAADSNNKVVIADVGDDNKVTVVKGTIKSAFIDNGVVKIRVDTFDEEGNPTGSTKVYSYSSIYKAGHLTAEDMNVTPEHITGESTSSSSGSSTSAKENAADVEAETKLLNSILGK